MVTTAWLGQSQDFVLLSLTYSNKIYFITDWKENILQLKIPQTIHCWEVSQNVYFVPNMMVSAIRVRVIRMPKDDDRKMVFSLHQVA